MKLKIEITMDNAAFEECSGDEVARILEQFAAGCKGQLLMAGEQSTVGLYDVNGNRVGEAKVTR